MDNDEKKDAILRCLNKVRRSAMLNGHEFPGIAQSEVLEAADVFAELLNECEDNAVKAVKNSRRKKEKR